MVKTTYILTLFVIVLVSVSCGGKDDPPIPPSPKFDDLRLSQTSLSMHVGSTEKVAITAGSGSYSVSSSNPEIATVALSGTAVKVTAIQSGITTIEVKDIKTGKTQNITITVEKIIELVITATSITLNEGNTIDITITSGSGSYAVETKNADIAIATLLGSAVTITAIKPGVATIEVKDTKTNRKQNITVTVEKTIPLMVSAEFVVAGIQTNIWVGGLVKESESIKIVSGYGNYIVEIKDTDIAAATLNNNAITVSAISVGETELIVKDTKSNQEKTIKVLIIPIVKRCPYAIFRKNGQTIIPILYRAMNKNGIWMSSYIEDPYKLRIYLPFIFDNTITVGQTYNAKIIVRHQDGYQPPPEFNEGEHEYKTTILRIFEYDNSTRVHLKYNDDVYLVSKLIK